MDATWIQKTAVAVTHCKRGRGLLKINGKSMSLLALVENAAGAELPKDPCAEAAT